MVKTFSTKKSNIPKAALRHLVLTKEVLELSLNPLNVDVIVEKRVKKELRVVVVEHMLHPITDLEELERYKQEVKKLEEEHKQKGGSIRGLERPVLPDSIDEIYYSRVPLIEAGVNTIGINDRGFLNYLFMGMISQIKKTSYMLAI